MTVDPEAVRAALAACAAILQRPDSPANLLLGLVIAVPIASVAFWIVGIALRR